MRLVGSLFGVVVLMYLGSYLLKQQQPITVTPTSPEVSLEQETQADSQSKPPKVEGMPSVTMVGPLASYMGQSPQPSNVESLHSSESKASSLDHVGDSPVGTSATILHQTFRVRAAVQLPFVIPPHAVNPQLHGNYRTLAKQVTGQNGNPNTPIEFLILSEEQYSAFLKGNSGEAIFDADEAPAQELSTSLPPTRDQPATYHLVFRNNSRDRGTKVVQADIRVDF